MKNLMDSWLNKIYIKKAWGVPVNPSIRLLTNKIENKITFKVKKGYYLKLWLPETLKLLGSTKSKITKDEDGGNVPYLEITEVVLVNCNAANNSYQKNSSLVYICS